MNLIKIIEKSQIICFSYSVESKHLKAVAHVKKFCLPQMLSALLATRKICLHEIEPHVIPEIITRAIPTRQLARPLLASYNAEPEIVSRCRPRHCRHSYMQQCEAASVPSTRSTLSRVLHIAGISRWGLSHNAGFHFAPYLLPSVPLYFQLAAPVLPKITISIV